LNSAIILCGGVKPHFAKKIFGNVLIKHTVDFLEKQGVQNIYLTVNSTNLKEARELINENKVKIIEETSPLGTAGPIKLLKNELRDTFLVVNGDVFFEMNFDDFIEFHRVNDGMITMALKSVKEPGKYGVVNMSGSEIVEFVEKPKSLPSYLINAGIYLMEPEILHFIPLKNKISLELDVFPSVAKEGKLFGYLISGKWLDVGRL
jgi:NDP-sugar pyrophosphorylase family protein